MRLVVDSTPWTLHNHEGLPILGNAHVPLDTPRGTVLIVHGLMGYKDYGMFPHLAARLAGDGFIAHRFNLAHSGMTNRIERFERPDLFESDTWNAQVADIETVMHAVARDQLPGHNLPLILLGHSRGGAAVLLTAGRHATRAPRNLDHEPPSPAAVIAIAAPHTCCYLDQHARETMLQRGYLELVSNRTGQTLRLGARWLQEQLDDPDAHNLLALVGRIRCPILLVHGKRDPSVPVASVHALAQAAGPRASVVVIDDADHVFNTPNPFHPDAPPSPQLDRLVRTVIEFARSVTSS